jgi:ornithine cyclodeaminase
MFTAAQVAPHLRRLLPVLIDELERAFTALGDGGSVNVPRRRERLGFGVRLQEMGGSAVVRGRHLAGTKMYMSGGGFSRSAGFVHLLDAQTGQPLALFSSSAIGAFRTAAASAVFIRALSPAKSRRAGLIGAGHQASWQLRALLEVRKDLEQVRVGARSQASAEAFCARHSELGVPLVPVAAARDAAAGADVVITATNSARAVLARADLGSDVHISAVGANSGGKRELASDVIAAATLVVVDDLVQARAESTDLAAAVTDGAFRWEQALSPSQALAKSRDPVPGITIFESQGIGLIDVVAAGVLFDDLSGPHHLSQRENQALE